MSRALRAPEFRVQVWDPRSVRFHHFITSGPQVTVSGEDRQMFYFESLSFAAVTELGQTLQCQLISTLHAHVPLHWHRGRS